MKAATAPLLPLSLDEVGYTAGDRRLLGPVSTRLGQAPVTALLGPNGAGKTLLLRLARGLLAPSQGTVRWGGRRPAEVGTRIGYVTQRPVLLRRSARANVHYALSLAGVPRAARPQQARAALAAVRLEHLAGTSAHRLSGGEAQRLAIARAWAQRPTALLLDEPAAHLDPAAGAAIEATIKTVRDAGTRVILCTHDLHQAQRLADEVVFLHAGTVREQQPGATFFAGPTSTEAERFLAGELLV
jgi:tungstate transport system ATP-binding protein